MTIGQEVLHKIKTADPGSILLSEDFSYLQKPDAVNTALSRYAKLKKVMRIGHGIYMKTQRGKVTSVVYPEAERVADVIAKRDRRRILPSGSYALYVLGLTTQIPVNLVYLTDGFPRKFKVGKRTVHFKQTTPKNLSLKGKHSSLVVQALREIGKGNVDKDAMEKLINVLKKEKFETLEHDMDLVPMWIGEIIAKAMY